MAISSRRSRRSNIEIWPGFVDALSQLVIVIIFVLLVFTAGQFFLSDALYGSNEALARLNSRIADLVDQLAFEKKNSEDFQHQISQLTSQLQTANVQRDALTAKLAEMSARADDAAGRANRSASDLAGAQSTVDQLNQQLAALREQLAQLAAALDASEAKSKEQDVQIADLGKRLNAALASKVEELNRYRSEFFGRLREVLGDRPDIHVVGDRFVFQSEVLFGLASADLSENAKRQLVPVAQALKQIAAKIPTDIEWVLRVDGHTDKRPISTPQFRSNWELSSARAISVVRFFIDQGIPANHLVAAGFGEFQPIVPGDSEDAYQRNRRIELKLTER
jgi:chemotaxis protein MotB